MEPIEAENIPIKCWDCYFLSRYLKIKWDKENPEGLDVGIQGWIMGNLQARIVPTIQQLCYALDLTEDEYDKHIQNKTGIGRILDLAESQLVGILMTQGKTKIAEMYIKRRKGWKDDFDINSRNEIVIKDLSELLKQKLLPTEVVEIQKIIDRLNGTE